MRYVASVSFGKDSLAMLLLILEHKLPLDEVVFYDTGMEFNSIYHIRDQVQNILNSSNVTFTELHPKMDFEYMMFEKPVKHRDGTTGFGYSWCGGLCRWGTRQKINEIDKYCSDAIQYVGIAADEMHRMGKEKSDYKRFPLIEYGMTEDECLSYCRSKGFKWIEDGVYGPIDLYSILDRVSCWCCCNKNLKELRNIYYYLPEYWNRLECLQRKTSRPMKGIGKSVFDLGKRFELECRTWGK